MPRQSLHLTDGRRVEGPAAAVWFGTVAASVWKWLEFVGQRRAERAMREVAQRRLRTGVTSGAFRG